MKGVKLLAGVLNRIIVVQKQMEEHLTSAQSTEISGKW